MFTAIWMMPEESIYGNWPVSGEMDLFESRGNRKLFLPSGQSIGSEQMFSTLVFGPDQDHVSWYHTHGELNSPPDQGFDRDFHNYSMEWTPSNYTLYSTFRASSSFQFVLRLLQVDFNLKLMELPYLMCNLQWEDSLKLENSPKASQVHGLTIQM